MKRKPTVRCAERAFRTNDCIDMQKLLTPQELSDLLQIKLSTIRKWTHFQYVPYVKLGRFVRFKESEILKWIEKKSTRGSNRRTVKPVEE